MKLPHLIYNCECDDGKQAWLSSLSGAEQYVKEANERNSFCVVDIIDGNTGKGYVNAVRDYIVYCQKEIDKARK